MSRMTSRTSLEFMNSGKELVGGACTMLFVPGDRPDRYGKAMDSGADVVIIDLEDAVEESAKAAALAEVMEALTPGQPQGIRALVRINPADVKRHAEEVDALAGLALEPGNGLLGLVLPKAEDPEIVAVLRNRFSEALALVPLVESAAGVVNAVDLAKVPGVTRLAFGAVDFALDIDAISDPRTLDYPRAHLVVVSRAAGIAPPLDTPSLEISDLKAVAAEARLARILGMGGKLCIHPGQLGPVVEGFRPTEEEIEWASRIADSGDGAAQIDGQMIDVPVVKRARRILDRSGRNGS